MMFSKNFPSQLKLGPDRNELFNSIKRTPEEKNCQEQKMTG